MYKLTKLRLAAFVEMTKHFASLNMCYVGGENIVLVSSLSVKKSEIMVNNCGGITTLS